MGDAAFSVGDHRRQRPRHRVRFCITHESTWCRPHRLSRSKQARARKCISTSSGRSLTTDQAGADSAARRCRHWWCSTHTGTEYGPLSGYGTAARLRSRLQAESLGSFLRCEQDV